MTPEEAERYLLSLELFGMRFGLDRMRRLMTALGHPERRFDSIHVVGTNGKSSTTRMIAAILARHGLRDRRLPVAAPRLVRRADPRSTTTTSTAAAVRPPRSRRGPRARPSWSIAPPRPTTAVTQFEALTAAAYSELAAPRGRGGGDRGRSRRPLRRHQRDPVHGAGADQRRPRAHPLAGPDDRPTSPREKLDVVQPGRDARARRRAATRSAVEVAERVAAERERADRRGRDRPGRRRSARRAPTSGATSRWRGRPPRPTSASSTEAAVARGRGDGAGARAACSRSTPSR